MSSIAGMGMGNSEILGPKASNIATRWGTVRGEESTHESVSSSRASANTAAAVSHDEEELESGFDARVISSVRGTYVSASGQVLFVVMGQSFARCPA
jgi:hypothetical protein